MILTTPNTQTPIRRPADAVAPTCPNGTVVDALTGRYAR
jgi:hypothetical protein